MKLIAYFHTDRKFKVLVDVEFSTPIGTAVRMPQVFVLVPVLFSLYINDALATPKLIFFSSGTMSVFTSCSLELQRVLAAVKSWCERWNMKVN
jgi:hypothetical protein